MPACRKRQRLVFPRGLNAVLLERAATRASPARATIASTLEGNSGVVDVATVVVLFVVLVVVVVEEVVVVVVLVVVVVVVEEVVLVDVATDEYVNVTTCDALAPLPPHVAFTENVPVVHAALPPGTEVSEKLPLVGLGKTSLMSAMLPAEFFTVMMTAVFCPGAGEMTPVILIG